MSTSVEVSTVVDEAAVHNIAHEEWLRDAMLHIVEHTLVPTARRLAPIRHRGASQHGAASIRAEAGEDRDGWYVDVSWDVAHDYMRFPERGTRYVTGEHFLEQAVKQSEKG
jgi:HK97 gp10 family phage protein